jgi:protein PhnA
MSLLNTLQERANNQCELCASEDNLTIYGVPPHSDENVDDSILVCATCIAQINKEAEMDGNHWRCLNDSMWSEVDAVKVVAWRMLNRLRKEGWPQDLIDMMYLEDDTLKWAKENK